MATPNNLTPTNCSWWPISALESDAARPAEAPDAPEAASPAHWPKESLVLYHWTQSFSSQKVEQRGAPGRGPAVWGWGGGCAPGRNSTGPGIVRLAPSPPGKTRCVGGLEETQRRGEGKRRCRGKGGGAAAGRRRAPFCCRPDTRPPGHGSVPSLLADTPSRAPFLFSGGRRKEGINTRPQASPTRPADLLCFVLQAQSGYGPRNPLGPGERGRGGWEISLVLG